MGKKYVIKETLERHNTSFYAVRDEDDPSFLDVGRNYLVLLNGIDVCSRCIGASEITQSVTLLKIDPEKQDKEIPFNLLRNLETNEPITETISGRVEIIRKCG